MFYVNKEGDVRLMEGALSMKDCRAVYDTDKSKDKSTFKDLITYIYFSYSNAEKNSYKNLYPEERKEVVIRDMNLFSGKISWKKIESDRANKSLIDKYCDICLSPSERTLRIMHSRLEEFEKAMLSRPINLDEVKEEKVILETMLQMQKLVKEYEKDVMIEKEQEEWKENMRLFEVPDDVWQ